MSRMQRRARVVKVSGYHLNDWPLGGYFREVWRLADAGVADALSRGSWESTRATLTARVLVKCPVLPHGALPIQSQFGTMGVFSCAIVIPYLSSPSS